jgi:hypothetical protein
MSDAYDKDLLNKFTNSSWILDDFSDDFMKMIRQAEKDVSTNSTSGKIASILLKHQAIHEMTKDLINLSHTYLQGEIWPTRISPKYDGGKEKMTYWYIEYYENNCIGCNGKTDFIKEVKIINDIRNKVAHNLAGKNDAMVNDSYLKFESHFAKAISHYNDECYVALVDLLTDLNRRVDFSDLIGG